MGWVNDTHEFQFVDGDVHRFCGRCRLFLDRTKAVPLEVTAWTVDRPEVRQDNALTFGVRVISTS